MRKCSKCNNDMIQLLTSWVCDCDKVKQQLGRGIAETNCIKPYTYVEMSADYSGNYNVAVQWDQTNWRSSQNGDYHYTMIDGGLSYYVDNNDHLDSALYEYGNYFRTKEQAEEASQEIKALLAKLHQKWGE